MPEPVKLTMDQILEAAKDPAIAKMVAEKAGLQIAVPKPAEKKEAPKRPQFIPPEDVNDTNAMLQALVKHIDAQNSFTDALIADSTVQLDQKVEHASKQSEAQKVQEFAAKVGKENFEKALPIMEGLYQRGEKLEDAFGKACKALDMKNPLVETKPPAPPPPKETPSPSVSRPPSLRITENPPAEGLTPKAEGKSLREIATNVLNAIEAEKGPIDFGG